MTADEFLAYLQRNDPTAPAALLHRIRAVLHDSPTARWELPEERAALVDALDFILKEKP